MGLDVNRLMVRAVHVVWVAETVAVIVVLAVAQCTTARAELTHHFGIQKTRHIGMWPI